MSVPLITPDNTKVGFVNLNPQIEPDKRPGAGRLESLGLGIKNTTDIVAIGKLSKDIFAKNYLDDEVPEGWNQVSKESVDGLPTEYWSRVFLGRSPREQSDIKRAILDEIEEKEYIARGGHWGFELAGNLGGSVGSISSLIPVAGQLKYATVTKGFFNNAVKQLPGLAAQAMVSNTLLVAASETKDLEDWVKDSFIETVAGSTIFGALGARQSYKINKAKEFLSDKWDGVQFKEVANPDGTFKTYEAFDTTGGSVGAARVKEINASIADGIDKYGESKLFQKIFSLSPITRGLTSPFESVRTWTNSIFSHNIVTGGIAKGQGQLPSAEDLSRFWTSQALSIEKEIGDLWAESAGLYGPLKDAQAKLKSGIMTRQEFEEAMFDPMFNGGVHDNPFVMKAAEKVRKQYDNMFDKLIEFDILDPKVNSVTDISYINRVYNKAKLQENPEQWINDVSEGIIKQNGELRQLWAPLSTIEENINSLKTQLSETTDEAIKNKLQKQIKQNKKKIKLERKSIQDKIDDGKIGIQFLDGKPQLSQEQLSHLKKERLPELKQRNALVKPLNKAKKDFRVAEDELKVHKRKLNEGRKPGQKNKVPDEEQIKLEGNLEEARAKLNEAKGHLKKYDTELDSRISKQITEGKLSPELVRFRPFSELRAFVNPKKTPFLRFIGDDAKAREVAKSVYDTILQETPEQMVSRIGGVVKSGGASPLKSRTLLLPTETLKPYLETNVTRLMNIQTGYIGKLLGFEQAMRARGFNSKDGIENFVTKLKDDFDIKFSKAKGAKERKKLQKEFDKAKDFIETSYQIYWGNYSPGNIGGKAGEMVDTTIRSLKNYSVSTMLGGVPFLQMGEMFANMFRHSFGEMMNDGLIPFLKSPEFRKMSKVNASDNAFGVNVALNAHMQQVWGNGANYQPKTGIERFTSNLADISGNLFGTNYIHDFNQTVTSAISQSKTIRSLKKYVEGKPLTKKETERLGLMRLDPETYAKRILNQFEKYGQRVKEGGPEAYLANYKNWDDFDASQAFLIAINKEVESVILSPNLLDTPFVFRNQFVGGMTQFMSYGFAATNSFLLSVLQRPDGEKMMAALMMMTLGATVGPLRKLSSGQELTEADFEVETILNEAVANSGVLGVYSDIFQKFNAAFDSPFTDNLKADRFRGKSAIELVAGPLGGILNNGLEVLNMFGTGQVNESGVKKAKNMLPLANALYFRYIGNKAVEALELPRTKGDATKWFEE